ncbi:hypothetical protein [Pseudescherichia sp.]|uniref:hypothetical protein n=1 Tax=Pseudescherichia sp. TaxID=2055881 RepID=UPI0028977E7B|nr:hypothetical protein [Pseudescherichia sp.]
MNAFEMEKNLHGSGFSGKDITALRHYIEKEGSSYPGLLSELNIRFIAAMILVLIMTGVWIYTVAYKDQVTIIAYSITMLIVAPIFYFLTPLKLGYKAFRYMRKR